MTVTNVDLMWMFNNEKSVSVPALVTNGRKYIGWQPCNNFTSIIPSDASLAAWWMGIAELTLEKPLGSAELKWILSLLFPWEEGEY